jgi:transposase
MRQKAAGWYFTTCMADAVFPPKSNPANERLAQHLWNHVDQLLTFLTVPGFDATNWRAELAIRFGVLLRKVWGGNRTWAGARAQSVLMTVWRTCWQQGRSVVDFLSQLLRGMPVLLALPPLDTVCLARHSNGDGSIIFPLIRWANREPGSGDVRSQRRSPLCRR